MTPASALLTQLRQLGATVAVINGRLRIEAPRGAVTAAMRRALADHKSELIAALDRSEDGDSRVAEPAECLAQIGQSFAALAHEYVGGAVALIASDPTLQTRLDAAVAAIDGVVQHRPSARAFQAALDAYVEVVREGCERLRARQEREVTERSDIASTGQKTATICPHPTSDLEPEDAR